MEFQARIEVFLELLSCAKPLFYWRYDGQGALLHSTCSSEKMLDAVLRHTGGLEYAYTAPKQAPLILNGDARLMWIAAREMSGNSVVEIHVLGPFSGMSRTRIALMNCFPPKRRRLPHNGSTHWRKHSIHCRFSQCRFLRNMQ